MSSATLRVGLIEQLQSCRKEDLPEQIDYYARYASVADYADRINREVVAVAASREGGLLTGHGPNHIRTVITRAAELLDSGNATISAYEAYLLLIAANLHDIGNAKGREAHELGAAEFVRESGISLGDDAQEKRTISGIAMAHGGSYKGNKDKISGLRTKEHILGAEVHTRFLAALLRFADELADDKTRSSKYNFDKGLIPPESEIYHKYVLSLSPPIIQGDSVSLNFEVTTSDLIRTFGKQEDTVLLLDEIFERTIKADRERIYCMRFLRPAIEIDKINVKIEVYDDSADQHPRFTIDYRLEETGYPSHHSPALSCSCSDPTVAASIPSMTGMTLKQYLEERQEAH